MYLASVATAIFAGYMFASGNVVPGISLSLATFLFIVSDFSRKDH
jgi:hypothetical protein